MKNNNSINSVSINTVTGEIIVNGKVISSNTSWASILSMLLLDANRMIVLDEGKIPGMDIQGRNFQREWHRCKIRDGICGGDLINLSIKTDSFKILKINSIKSDVLYLLLKDNITYEFNPKNLYSNPIVYRSDNGETDSDLNSAGITGFGFNENNEKNVFKQILKSYIQKYAKKTENDLIPKVRVNGKDYVSTGILIREWLADDSSKTSVLVMEGGAGTGKTISQLKAITDLLQDENERYYFFYVPVKEVEEGNLFEYIIKIYLDNNLLYQKRQNSEEIFVNWINDVFFRCGGMIKTVIFIDGFDETKFSYQKKCADFICDLCHLSDRPVRIVVAARNSDLIQETFRKRKMEEVYDVVKIMPLTIMNNTGIAEEFRTPLFYSIYKKINKDFDIARVTEITDYYTLFKKYIYYIIENDKDDESAYKYWIPHIAYEHVINKLAVMDDMIPKK